MIRTYGALALLALPLFAACNSDDDGTVVGDETPAQTGPADTLEAIDLTGAPLGIVDLPAEVDARIRAVFARYTAVATRDGGRLHLLAQPGVADELLFRTRVILAQHVGDFDNPTSTVDKSAVEAAMVERDATLAVALDGAAWDPADPDVTAVLELFDGSLDVVRADEMVQEGSTAYVLPAPGNDRTLGGTAAFVLRQGIATGAPAYAGELAVATDEAVQNGRFVPPAGLASDEVDGAYLALAIDVYYGVWGHDPRGDGSAGPSGEYAFHTRAGMAAGDPLMVAALERFFPALNTYPAFLSDDFALTFEMAFSQVLPYTHRSRYLERVGVRENGLVARVNGNQHDNVFVGNASANVFEGRGGNDLADMGGGGDIAYFEGVQAEYTITEVAPNTWRIEDSVLNRDGIDDVRGVAQLEFADGTLFL